jgi:hypothetical protein
LSFLTFSRNFSNSTYRWSRSAFGSSKDFGLVGRLPKTSFGFGGLFAREIGASQENSMSFSKYLACHERPVNRRVSSYKLVKYNYCSVASPQQNSLVKIDAAALG